MQYAQSETRAGRFVRAPGSFIVTVQFPGCYGDLQESCGAELSLPLCFWIPDALSLLLSSMAASNLVTHISLGHMGTGQFLPLPPGPLSPQLRNTPGDRQLS